MNGSFPPDFDGAVDGDGLGLSKVTPSTDGDTDGLPVGVRDGAGVDVAGQALLLAVVSAKPRNVLVKDGLTRGFNGIGGGGSGAAPALAVTVTTMLSDTATPCANASAPSVRSAAVAIAALSMNLTIEARRRERCLRSGADIG